jgi:hypothetical protein
MIPGRTRSAGWPASRTGTLGRLYTDVERALPGAVPVPIEAPAAR